MYKGKSIFLLLTFLCVFGVTNSSSARGILLWNKLGSEYEITHSEIGPDGEIVGEVLFESCQYGNGYRSAVRTGDPNIPDNLIRFPNLKLGPQGCIEFWYHPDWNDWRVGHVINLIEYGIPEESSLVSISFGFNDWQDRGAGWARDVIPPYDGMAVNHFYPSSEPEWSTEKPFHIAFTWDASLESKYVTVYINGKEVGTREIYGDPHFLWLYAETPYLYVGSRMYSGDWDRHHWEPNIDGIIDNIKVWDYAKTDFSDRFSE